ncbi:nuclear transport factor 2 family protein [Mycobacterium interjectum]|uniref:nuclear transport factor 2 family protein n=1 Tax=Mycobacterium interjectum TaxID=33895 RepID=UPI000833E2A5|nr:nuclear transport factor 2 family protein [Mycobacterium interjectum]MCV7092134.1 nuclear transport factor 2 family protein [Mycobacterium interjectum]
MTTCCCGDRTAIVNLLNRYATCLDDRHWQGLEEVFHPEARGHYGSLIEGRSAIIASIRTFLGGCGPSQHLLGNYQIDVDGDHAKSSTQARVIHLGSGDRMHLRPYEAIGSYHDQYVRTPGGWRIISRHFDVRISIGDIGVLRPG